MPSPLGGRRVEGDSGQVARWLLHIGRLPTRMGFSDTCLVALGGRPEFVLRPQPPRVKATRIKAGCGQHLLGFDQGFTCDSPVGLQPLASVAGKPSLTRTNQWQGCWFL